MNLQQAVGESAVSTARLLQAGSEVLLTQAKLTTIDLLQGTSPALPASLTTAAADWLQALPSSTISTGIAFLGDNRHKINRIDLVWDGTDSLGARVPDGRYAEAFAKQRQIPPLLIGKAQALAGGIKLRFENAVLGLQIFDDLQELPVLVAFEQLEQTIDKMRKATAEQNNQLRRLQCFPVVQQEFELEYQIAR